MAAISFTVVHDFDAPAERVWAEMIDWPAHGEWIPATRVEIDEGDPSEVGALFTGYTGYGPVMLVDHMRLTQLDWDEVTSSGTCEVEKLGPVLKGRAGFTIAPADAADPAGGTRLEWFEDVEISWIPGFAAPVVNKLSAAGFKQGMKRLDRNLTP